MAPARFVIIFAMAVATAHGADCPTSMKFKSTVSSLKCGGASTTVDSCMSCCEPKDGYCMKMFLTKSCPNTHFADYSKNNNAATDANFNAQCCTTKKTCDVACTDGYKDKANKATTTCAGSPCASAECCEPDPLTCGGALLSLSSMASGEAKNTLLLQIKNGTDADKVVPGAKMGTTVDASYTDFESKCYEDKATCTASCPTGWKDKTDKATKKCTTKPCLSGDCCDTDTTKCMFFKSKTCPATHFKDTAKAGNAVKADGTDFNAQCCTTKATCAAFQTATSNQDASGSTRQMVATSSVLAMVGFILASKYI